MERRAPFTVGLIDACPGGHQRDGTLVAAIGGCVVQWGPGEKRRRVGKRIGGRSKCNQMCGQKLLGNILLTQSPTPPLPSITCLSDRMSLMCISTPTH